MRRESLVLAVSGAFFGLIVGWILGSQQPSGPAGGRAQAPVTQATAGSDSTRSATSRVVDEARVGTLESSAERDATDARPRVELGNLYFDAERYPDAIRWYEAAFAIDPTDPNVSTDLGVSYYYSDDPDRALEQFARSLEADPRHVKTLLNLGIVRAFGKQDLEGAATAWQQVVDIAPDSPEGRAAGQAIEAMRGAHPDFGGGQAPSGGN